MVESNLVIAIPFLLLGIAHSVLGERRLIGPLLQADWRIPRFSREPADRILRFAWHLTSVTWFGLALVFLGADLLMATAVIGGASALIIFVLLRAHLAWPLMLLVCLAAMHDGGWLGDGLLRGAGWISVALLGAAAALHVYWALGGRRWASVVIPTSGPGESLFSPPPLATAAVAVLLGGFATLVALHLLDAGPFGGVRVLLLWVGVGVLALRAAGDGRFVGFSKSVRGTSFAQADDAWFTPLIVALAFGSTAAAIL